MSSVALLLNLVLHKRTKVVYIILEDMTSIKALFMMYIYKNVHFKTQKQQLGGEGRCIISILVNWKHGSQAIRQLL